jgi:hypothetical protein
MLDVNKRKELEECRRQKLISSERSHDTEWRIINVVELQRENGNNRHQYNNNKETEEPSRTFRKNVPKLLYHYKPKGRRWDGRPTKRWKEQVKC